MRLLVLCLVIAASALDPLTTTFAQEGGAAPTKPGTQSPFSTRKRSRVKEGGPTTGTDKAALDALRWFVRHQNEDGSWSAETLPAKCTSSTPCGPSGVARDPVRDVGLTALVVSCFLGMGFSHASSQDIVDTQLGVRHNSGDVVSRGLAWIEAHQREDGCFGPTVNGFNVNAIATLAMCEAEGLTQDGVHRSAATKALKFLCSEQLTSPSGKGRFGFSSRESEPGNADVVATAWAANALHAAKQARFEVDQACLDGIVEYARTLASKSGEKAAKKSRGDEDWAGYLRFFVAPSRRDAGLDLGEKNVLEHLPSGRFSAGDFDWTRWLFDALFLHQLDYPLSALKRPDTWVPANKAQVDVLLAAPDYTQKTCRHGAWPVGEEFRRDLGPIYSTAIAVRTLEVYFLYEPAFAAPPPPDAPPKPKK